MDWKPPLRSRLASSSLPCIPCFTVTSSPPQAKIRSLSKRHGANPDLWPISQFIKPVYPSQPAPIPPASPPPPPSPSAVQVSWSIESINPGDSPALNRPYSLPPSSSSSSLQSTLDLDHPLFADVLLPAPSPKSSYEDSPNLPLSREEPDGRSDASNHSVDALGIPASSSSPCSVSTPPCTPQPPSPGDHGSQVTPEMISSALEALTQAASHASSTISTPQEERHLPELISQTLSSWITDHSSCATPPSTPMDMDEASQPQAVSAADLIAALTSAISLHRVEEVGSSTGRESGVPSVPACTPQEGLLELAKLGIQPEDILEALSALSIVREEEGGVEEVVKKDDEEETEQLVEQKQEEKEEEEEGMEQLEEQSQEGTEEEKEAKHEVKKEEMEQENLKQEIKEEGEEEEKGQDQEDQNNEEKQERGEEEEEEEESEGLHEREEETKEEEELKRKGEDQYYVHTEVMAVAGGDEKGTRSVTQQNRP